MSLPAFCRLVLVSAALASTVLAAQQAPQHLQIHVQMPAASAHGRLLVFASAAPDPAKPGDKTPALLSVNPFFPGATFVAAREVETTAPNTLVDIDLDASAYPSGFSTLPAGKYLFQALLDVDHTYSYSADEPQDWMSAQAEVTEPAATLPSLVLAAHPAENPAAARARQAIAPGSIEDFSIPSAHLTRFFGQPTAVTGVVLYPPNYTAAGKADRKTRFPTVFYTQGFGGTHASSLLTATNFRKSMAVGDLPPMFVVLLDENCHTGTHEFIDSVNNGPWGTALVEEAIPALEARFRMDSKPSGRFLTGHSSGGWATLQLQINHPDVFGGTWSTSPDPSDFHNFTGVDLYAPNANVFHKPDGTPNPLVRDHGKIIATVEQFSRLEDVLGTEGGQLHSFDWVFSPRGADGLPVPMYDHVTGTIDPAVVRYWRDNFDLVVDLQRRWPTQAAQLRGKLHVIVGTADTFYLNESAQLFDNTLQQLNAGTRVQFIPDRTHMDLYVVGDDRRGLTKVIFKQMYAVARPNAN